MLSENVRGFNSPPPVQTDSYYVWIWMKYQFCAPGQVGQLHIFCIQTLANFRPTMWTSSWFAAMRCMNLFLLAQQSSPPPPYFPFWHNPSIGISCLPSSALQTPFLNTFSKVKHIRPFGVFYKCIKVILEGTALQGHSRFSCGFFFRC